MGQEPTRSQAEQGQDDAGYGGMAAMLESLRDHITANGVGQGAAAILDQLILHAQGHFGREEELMTLCPAYERTDSHRVAHAKFLIRLERLAETFRQSGWLPEEAPRLIDEWWGRHMEECDRDLIDHVQRQFAAGRAAE